MRYTFWPENPGKKVYVTGQKVYLTGQKVYPPGQKVYLKGILSGQGELTYMIPIFSLLCDQKFSFCTFHGFEDF